MVDKSSTIPLIVITGPTASGKTSLAIKLAKKYDGEIICADSRSIYKGADIGTAKPCITEQSNVPHWGLDIIEPGAYFSAANFKDYANHKITEIRKRGHIPFLVGGTGLYIDAVIFNYQFGPPVDVDIRVKLQKMNIEELYKYCKKYNINLPENYKNKRYVIRAIENKDRNMEQENILNENTVVVGIATEKAILRSRITQRSEQIFNDNVINEAKKLGEKYGWDNEAMKSNIYPLIHAVLDEKISLSDAKMKFITLDWRLAKRQLTWLRRNKFIHWLSLDDAEEYLSHILAIHN